VQINIIYDDSANSAPASFKAAVEAAVAYFEAAYSNPITINIAFGWGESGGDPIAAGQVAVGVTAGAYALTYADVRDALWAAARSADDRTAVSALTNADPTHGGLFLMGSAQAKALGLIAGDDSSIDGYVGLSSSTAFTFDPANRAIPGMVDAIGALEREISTVLGRASGVGDVLGDGETYATPLDLFRYAVAGTLAPAAANGSFSIDGQHLLAAFNTPSNGGDAGDWAASVAGDAFDAVLATGVKSDISATDAILLDVLGYTRTPAPPTAPTVSQVPADSDVVIAADTHWDANHVFYSDYTGDWNTYAPSVVLQGIFGNGVGPSLYNAGIIFALSDHLGAQGVSVMPNHGWFPGAVFDNLPGGVVYAQGNDQAVGYQGSFDGLDVINGGLIEAVANRLDATGVTIVDSVSGRTLVNQAGGVIRASSIQGKATGAISSGADFTNAGTIEATGHSALGAYAGGQLFNSGTIIATTTDGSAQSVGVELYFPAFNNWTHELHNSGLIEADIAFEYTIPTFNHNTLYDINLDNSGTMIGDIVLGDAKITILNTGTIAGDIYFGDSDNIYDGRGGALRGAIYLGAGHSTVHLGDDGEIIFGGEVGDNITGGAGDDFIGIGRGVNHIDGGGGFNTLSFASSPGGVTLDLGAGTATSGGGSDTIAHIQQVVGSLHADTLKAGATSATLIGLDGYDTLIGGAGGDTLVGGRSGGLATGGGGADTFIYTGGALTLTDFKAGGQHDVLQIRGYDASVAIQQIGADTKITLSSGDYVLLQNVQASSLTAGDITYSASPYRAPDPLGSLVPYGTYPIHMTEDFTVAAGETFAISLGPYAFWADGHALTNNGAISIAYDTAAIDDYVFGVYATSLLTNGAGATFDVFSPPGAAQGAFGGVVNAGHFNVHATGYAIGAGRLDNTATGVATVTSVSGHALGVDTSGGVHNNAGAFTVTGYDRAIWLRDDGSMLDNPSITNSGVITVTTTQPGAPATGLAFAGLHTSTVHFTNSGVLTAERAVYAYDNSYSYGQMPGINLSNTGTINGLIILGDTADTITNSGAINGAIRFGLGNSTYNGAGGSQTGGIYLGQGTNTATLGIGGSIVFGNLYSDTMTGGAGDDVFVVSHAASVIDGGGGSNTVSFAGALGAVTVDLGGHTAMAGANDTLVNIQQVIGSQYGDTIKGASTADTLAGGKGNDQLTGGGGADTFVFAAGDQHDTITDFKAGGDADVLHIYGYASAQSVTQTGADTLITLSATDSILLKNVAVASLTGADVVYSAGAAPSAPTPVDWGASQLQLIRPLTFHAGETLNFVNPGAAIFDTAEHITGSYVQQSVTNGGTINVTQASGGVTGFVGDYSSGSVNTVFNNLAGAKFTVTAMDGLANGMFVGSFGEDLTNAGLYQVTASANAYGVQTWDSEFDLVNAAGASFLVTGGADAYGLALHNSGSILNNGLISVTGSGQVAAVAVYEGGNPSKPIINNGTIIATATGSGHSTAFLKAGNAGGLYITNNGTITAQDFISGYGDYGASFDVINNGVINGNFNVHGPGGSLVNHGVINGDLKITDGGTSAAVFDLRDGTFNGHISITLTFSDQFSKTTIYTGAAPTTVDFNGYFPSPYIHHYLIGGGATSVHFDFTAAQGAVAHNADGTWTVAGGLLTLSNVQTLIFTDQTVTLPAHNVPSDFNLDGKSDVLWRNDSGEIYVWNSQSGQGAFLGQTLGNPGTGWHVQDVADYSGDGKADILWRNNAGDLYVYKSDGGAAVSFTGQSISFVDPVWAIVPQAGDFNGDGRADILFRNTGTGEAYVWLSQTGSSAVNFLGQSLGAVPSNWSIKGVGDFNGDGRADVLWRSDAGDVYVWNSDASGPVAMHGQTISSVGNDWSLIGIGDFNGDGREDILWRHTDGELYVWNSQTGSAAVNFVGQSVGLVSLDWSVAAVGDYDGDGRADVLFRNADGRVYLWNSNDTGPAGFTGQGLGTTATDWHILSDFHGM
jgi:Ca2+-binding RTX toxin-like protein